MAPGNPFVHMCQLKADELTRLPPLPPNASWLRKFFRTLRECTLLDPKNVKLEYYFGSLTEALMARRAHMRGKYFYIIHPLSKFNSWRQRVMFVVFYIMFILDPFHDSFFRKTNYKELSLIFHVILMANCMVFLNIGFTFLSGYLVHYSKEIELTPKLIAVHYLKSYFIPDVVGNIRLDYLVANILNSSELTLEIVSLFQFIKFIRVLHLWQILYKAKDFFQVREQYILCISYSVFTTLILHVWSCWIYKMHNLVTLIGGEPNIKSWFVQAKIQQGSDASAMEKYLECLHTVCCHFLGVGQGTYLIKDVLNEQIIMSLVLITGRLYTLLITAHLLHVFGVVNISESKYEQLQSQFKHFMFVNMFPKSLKKRMTSFVEYKFQKHYYREDVITSSLSEKLQDEIYMHNCRVLLEKPIFKTMSKTYLNSIVKSFRKEVFMPKDFVFAYEEEIQRVYFIAHGTVVFYNKDGVELLHLHDGDLIGVGSLLAPSPTSLVNIIAVEICEMYSVEVKVFFHMLKSQPAFNNMIQTRAKREINWYQRAEKKFYESGYTSTHFLAELKEGHILEKRGRRPKFTEL